MKSCGLQILLCWFTFGPIVLKQLNSLTTIDTFCWLSGSEVTHLNNTDRSSGKLFEIMQFSPKNKLLLNNFGSQTWHFKHYFHRNVAPLAPFPVSVESQNVIQHDGMPTPVKVPATSQRHPVVIQQVVDTGRLTLVDVAVQALVQQVTLEHTYRECNM